MMPVDVSRAWWHGSQRAAWWKRCSGARFCRGGEEGSKKFFDNALDEIFETLHNLASLLLTNTTLRSDATNPAEQNRWIFNN